MNTIGLNGSAQLSVIQAGREIRRCEPVRNLIMDQGLDKLATMPICDLFLHALVGLGSTSNESAQKPGQYLLSSIGTVSKDTGAIDFTSADVGLIMKFVSGGTTFYSRVKTLVSASQVTISPRPSSLLLATCTPLRNQQTALDREFARSNTYSQAAGDNITQSPSAGVRTHRRVFVFAPFTQATETRDFTCSAASGTVTITAGAGRFDTSDIGKTLFFRTARAEGVITNVATDGTTCTINNNNVYTSQQVILLGLKDENLGGIYRQDNGSGAAGSIVTRVSGSRDFRPSDVGKKLYFVTANVDATITGYTSPTVVTVSVSRLLTPQAATLHGYMDVREVGFSETGTVGSNLNIRIPLPAPVRVMGATPASPSEQLKVTYTMTVSVGPIPPASVSPGGIISGGFNAGSAQHAIENVQLSTINPNGTTNATETDLEPFDESHLALTTDGQALVGGTGVSRNQNVVLTPLVGASYTPGSFTRTYTGAFPPTEGTRTDWRGIMLYNPVTQRPGYTFLFTVAQAKPSDYNLSLTFTKSWDYNGNS